MSDRDKFAWLREALGDGPRHPLLFSSAAYGSCYLPAFWKLSPEIDDFRPLADCLLPRQGAAVVIADTLSESHRRQFVGLQLAALLAERGRRVALVDAELEHEGFTRSLDDPDAEGWFDLVLYGASPGATVQEAPLPGIRILAAGSVRPAAGELLDANGIHRGLAQLKHEYDCVLLVRGASTARGEWSELFEHADGVFLLAGSEDAHAAELTEWLHEHEFPLWGGAVLGSFALDVDMAVEDTLSEASSEPVAPAPPPRQAPPVVEDEEVPGASSPIFRNVTLVLVAALLAFVGWWAWSQRGTESRSVDLARSTPEEQISGEGAAQLPTDAPSELSAADSTSANPVAENAQDVAAETAAEQETTTPERNVSRQDQPADELPEKAGVEIASDPVPLPREPEQRSDEPPAVVNTPVRRPPVRAPQQFAADDPLLAEVGSGWALHPWSFPDSNEALSALAPLIRRGMKPIVRGFVLEERGRWYRVLVGRFSTRAQAMEARDRLIEVRGIDWVGVVRVP